MSSRSYRGHRTGREFAPNRGIYEDVTVCVSGSRVGLSVTGAVTAGLPFLCPFLTLFSDFMLRKQRRRARAGVALISGLSMACASSEEAEPADDHVNEPADEEAGSGSSGANKPPMTLADCELPTCPVSVDPALKDGPEVSFRDDVYPILQRACSDAACHGTEPALGADLFLGAPPPAVVDTSELLDRLVNVASRTAPALPLVESGEPEQSFLLIKIDGCQNAVDLECTAQPGATSGQDCGDNMPQAGRPVCNADRELLRQWILQGAKDN